MSVIAISEPGGPEKLQLARVARPNPIAGQVLIRVEFAGVNRPDCIQRAGHYPPPPGASPLPGLEVSGEIVAIGEGVASEAIGSKICALVNGGGYGQYCIAQYDNCLPVPKGLSMEEAAALPETLLTVWHNVFQRGYARDGECLLVHGGTSGIGTMAIKLAKLFDMRVIVTCGSDEKCAAARTLGADHAINYKTQDFVEQAREITGGKGCDIILDMVAGDYTQRNLDTLCVEGRLVTIAVLGGAKAQINMAKMMVKRQMMTGSTLRARSDEFKGLLTAEILREVWPMVEQGALRPQLDETFPLQDAAKAHIKMEAGDHIGKITLSLRNLA